MSDRYIKIYSLEEKLYSTGSPVIITAGRLTKDTLSGNIFVQLKLLNISDSVIKAVKLSINSFDANGESTCERTQYAYNDLAISRNTEFGQKNVIILSDNAASSFEVELNSVAFDDDSVWIPEKN